MTRRAVRALCGCVGGVAVLVLLAATGCGSSGDEPKEAPKLRLTAQEQVLARLAGEDVMVGGVAFTTTLVAIDFDRTAGQPPRMRIFVSDGFPGGTAEWFEGNASSAKRFALTSASGNARIEGTIGPVETEGTIAFGDKEKQLFFTRPAGHGAGIWNVKVDKRGKWSGRSLDGSKLTARQTGDRVNGTIRTPKGVKYRLSHADLSRDLRYSVKGGAADTYTLVVTRRATEMVGRGGGAALRRGKPSRNLIALDLPKSEKTVPGVFFGRVAFTTDRLLFDINKLSDGKSRLRAYTSDAEPEPAGDIEWFTSEISGPKFSLRSASGNSRIKGTIKGDAISGTLTLPNAKPRRFYAKAAGDGAGVYDVRVAEGQRYTGRSEEGSVLEMSQKGELVMGTIKTPGGKVVDLLGADLTLAFRYPEPGSQPDTYVAFAAPEGRFLIGRSGNVRGGRPGVNIIGLDKKC